MQLPPLHKLQDRAKTFIRSPIALFFCAAILSLSLLWLALFLYVLPSQIGGIEKKINSHPALHNKYQLQIHNPSYSFWGYFNAQKITVIDLSDKDSPALVFQEPRFSLSVFSDLLRFSSPSLTVHLPSTHLDPDKLSMFYAAIESSPALEETNEKTASNKLSSQKPSSSFFLRLMVSALTHCIQLTTSIKNVSIQDPASTTSLNLSAHLQIKGFLKSLILNQKSPRQNLIRASLFHGLHQQSPLADLALDLAPSPEKNLLLSCNIFAANISRSFPTKEIPSSLVDLSKSVEKLQLRLNSTEDHIAQWLKGSSEKALEISFATSVNCRAKNLKKHLPQAALDLLANAPATYLGFGGIIEAKSLRLFSLKDTSLTLEKNHLQLPLASNSNKTPLAHLQAALDLDQLSCSYQLRLPLSGGDKNGEKNESITFFANQIIEPSRQSIENQLDFLRLALGLQRNKLSFSESALWRPSNGAIVFQGVWTPQNLQNTLSFKNAQINLGHKFARLDCSVDSTSTFSGRGDLSSLKIDLSSKLELLSNLRKDSYHDQSFDRGLKAEAAVFFDVEQKAFKLEGAHVKLSHGLDLPNSEISYSSKSDLFAEEEELLGIEHLERAALSLSLDPIFLERVWSDRTLHEPQRVKDKKAPTFTQLELNAGLPPLCLSTSDWKLQLQKLPPEQKSPVFFHLFGKEGIYEHSSFEQLDLRTVFTSIDPLTLLLTDPLKAIEADHAKELFFSKDSFRLHAVAQGVQLQSLKLDRLELRTEGSDTSERRIIDCHMQEQTQALDLGFCIAVDAASDLRLETTSLPALSLLVSDLHGSWRGKKASLREPIALTHSEKGLLLSLQGLQLDGGTLHLQAHFPPAFTSLITEDSSLPSAGASEPPYTLSMQSNHFPLDLLSSVLPYGVQGRLDSHVDLSFSAHDLSSSIRGKWTAGLKGLSLEREKKHSYFKEMNLEGGIDAHQAIMKVSRGDKMLATFTTAAPITSDSPLIHCDFHLQLSQIVRLFLSKDFALEGLVKGQMDFPLMSPLQAQGSAVLQKATFSYNPLKINLFQVSSDQAQVQILPEKILIHQLKGSDHLEGVFDLNTQLDFGERFSYRLSARTENLKLFESTHLKTLTTGQLLFSGDQEKAQLSGSITLPGARAYIPSALPSSLPDLGDFEVKRLLPSFERLKGAPTMEKSGDTTLLRGPDEGADEEGLALLLDLNLEFPPGSRLVGRGLDSRWQGELSLSGSRNNPLLHGGLNLTEGNLTFGGKRFTVGEGKLHFHGDVKKETRIHIVSEFPLRDVTIRAILQGPLISPKLDFQSTPFMPLPDIFSQLLFRKSKEALSSLQALQVAQLALETRGESPDADLISRIRQTSGIDVITVGSSPVTARSKEGSSQGGSTAVDTTLKSYTIKVGKYITPNLLLACTRDVSSQQTTLDVELDLTPQLSLIAEYDTVYRDGHLNLMWKKDY